MANNEVEQTNTAQSTVVEETTPIDTTPLRIAPPLPESEPQPELEEEEEVEEEEEEEEEEETPTAMVYAQRYGIQALLWLQTLWSLVSSVASTTQTISRGVLRSLQTPLYVSFRGSSFFYRRQDYTLSGPGVAPVEWYYNADTKQFLSSLVYNTTNEYETHHFEWLSGQIKYNDLILYDVSEFLQQIRWAGTTRPSTAHVLAAWSLESGIVLNTVDGLTLQVIKEDGTEANLEVRGERA